jgi:hypothetical protein
VQCAAPDHVAYAHRVAAGTNWQGEVHPGAGDGPGTAKRGVRSVRPDLRRTAQIQGPVVSFRATLP